MMRWCARDDKRVWGGRGRRWGERTTSRSVTQSSSGLKLASRRRWQPPANWKRRLPESELVSKDKFKFRVAVQLNIQRNSPLDLPFGCASFIAAENEIKAFSFVYLFVHNFALLHCEDSTASPWFGCFYFSLKKKEALGVSDNFNYFFKIRHDRNSFRVPESCEAPPVETRETKPFNRWRLR